MLFDLPSLKRLARIPYQENYGLLLPAVETTEIPGLTIGIPSGAITLEWSDVEFPALAIP